MSVQLGERILEISGRILGVDRFAGQGRELIFCHPVRSQLVTRGYTTLRALSFPVTLSEVEGSRGAEPLGTRLSTALGNAEVE